MNPAYINYENALITIFGRTLISMQANHLDEGKLCNFCKYEFKISFATESTVQMIGKSGLLPCPKCYSLTTLSDTKDFFNHDAQGIFHEAIFGTEDSFVDDYIADALSLRKLVSDDYAYYFGDKRYETICEVGAGRGSLLKALCDEGYSAFGCEYSEKLVATGKTIYGMPNSIFFQLNAWDLPSYLEANSIKPTVLVMWHVIEHIQNSFALLESLISACADNITLIFQTPLPVPKYVFPEHLFFPSTETYHFVAERLGLSIKLLNIIPYTRYVTCVMSNKDVPKGNIYPRQQGVPEYSVIGQLIEQLDAGLQELDHITKEQYANITQLQAQLLPIQSILDKPLTLVKDLVQMVGILKSSFVKKENTIALSQQVQQLTNENESLRLKLLRAETQLDLLKDILIKNPGDDSL